ncbi:hypothetical protein D3C72_2561930 [compost metagenome]
MGLKPALWTGRLQVALLFGVARVPVVADGFIHRFAQSVDAANRAMGFKAEPGVE